MAQLKVKGVPQLVEVPDSEARSLRGKIDKGEIGNRDFVTLGQFSGEVGQITAILLPENEYMSNEWAKRGEAYWQEREKILAMSPRGKAEHTLSLFSLLFWAMTGSDPAKEIGEKAVQSAEAYFALEAGMEKRRYPDLTIWRGLMKPFQKTEKFLSEYHQTAFRAVERCLSADVEASGIHANKISERPNNGISEERADMESYQSEDEAPAYDPVLPF